MATVSDQLVKHIDSQIDKAIEDAIEALRWGKRHRSERKAIDTLRLVQANLGYIAIALDWEMEGEALKSDQALRKLWWQPSKELEEDTFMGVQGC